MSRHISPNYREGISAYDPVTQTSFYVEGTEANGAVNVNGYNAGTLVQEYFDYIAATYPDSVTEVYTYKSGGAGGVTVAVVTIVYTTSAKTLIDTVTRT